MQCSASAGRSHVREYVQEMQQVALMQRSAPYRNHFRPTPLLLSLPLHGNSFLFFTIQKLILLINPANFHRVSQDSSALSRLIFTYDLEQDVAPNSVHTMDQISMKTQA
jgi:hypothetical protein